MEGLSTPLLEMLADRGSASAVKFALVFDHSKSETLFIEQIVSVVEVHAFSNFLVKMPHAEIPVFVAGISATINDKAPDAMTVFSKSALYLVCGVAFERQFTRCALRFWLRG